VRPRQTDADCPLADLQSAVRPRPNDWDWKLHHTDPQVIKLSSTTRYQQGGKVGRHETFDTLQLSFLWAQARPWPRRPPSSIGPYVARASAKCRCLGTVHEMRCICQGHIGGAIQHRQRRAKAKVLRDENNEDRGFIAKEPASRRYLGAAGLTRIAKPSCEAGAARAGIPISVSLKPQ